MAVNNTFQILGVNLYRSFDSEFGPFERITDVPVGSTFWRDQTDDVVELDEDVTQQFTVFRPPTAVTETPKFVFKVRNGAIIKPHSQKLHANAPSDVMVFVDGVQARVLSVYGASGEVELDVRDFAETGTQTKTRAILPTANSKVTCTYHYTKSFLRTDLMQRVFYRVTTVGILPETQELVETPLEQGVATTSYETEKRDHIWNEAVRRNRWILDQGGERVKVFLRKHTGTPCPCIPNDHQKQPVSDCLDCYGSGYLGGYEGPYNIILAPDDGERRSVQKEQGRTIEHTYEVWTGPVPILSQRDFIVKLNGERYSIGPVRFPSNRGMILQQHFNIGHLDEKAIQYSVPMDRPKYPYVGFEPGPLETSTSEITEKENIPDDREERGRTLAWSNTNY